MHTRIKHHFLRSSAVVKGAVLGSLLAGVLISASPSFAGPGFKDCKQAQAGEFFGPGKGAHRLTKVLELSDVQRETLKAQRDTQVETSKALRDQTQQARQALTAAVEAGESDSRLQALADQLGKLETQQALERAKAHKAFLAVLTPEQKTKLAELKAEREAKLQERREKWSDKRQEKQQS